MDRSTVSLTAAQQAEVLHRYEQGESGSRIARAMDCSDGTVYNVLKRHGVDRRVGGTRLLSLEQEREVLERYTAGEPTASLLEDFGITQSALFGIRSRHGVPARPFRPAARAFTPEQEAVVVSDYQAGAPLSAVARRHGVTPGTVHKLLNRRGISRRRPGNAPTEFSDDQVADIVRRWLAGEAQGTIGAAYGVSQAVVSRLVRARGHVRQTKHARGASHGSWQGGRVKNSSGYVSVYVDQEDPLAVMAGRSGYVLEHRYLMAQKLGRPLERHETVHHINGDKTDNRPENLQVRAGRHGNGQAMQCGDCGSHNVIHVPLSG